VVEAVPSTLEGFFDLRDAIFLQRRARIFARRARERAWFEEHVIEEGATGGSGRPRALITPGRRQCTGPWGGLRQAQRTGSRTLT